jgi:hypothetical protein
LDEEFNREIADDKQSGGQKKPEYRKYIPNHWHPILYISKNVDFISCNRYQPFQPSQQWRGPNTD